MEYQNDYRTRLGMLGEDLACEYLEQQGYTIIARNYQVGHSDIDILVRDGEFLVFVEVRTKSGGNKGTPEETINKKKIRQMTKTAELYMLRKNYQGLARLDAVCIIVNTLGQVESLHHYKTL